MSLRALVCCYLRCGLCPKLACFSILRMVNPLQGKGLSTQYPLICAPGRMGTVMPTDRQSLTNLKKMSTS